MNFYIVTFDRETNVSYKDFHTAFVGNPEITRYFHYIKSSYLIGTEMTAKQLSEFYVQTANSHGLKANHLVLSIDRTKKYGLLPKDAWEWFKR